MANALLDAIARGNELGKPLAWLDSEAYGSQLVLSGKPYPWHNPTQFVSVYGQVQDLLKAEVAPVHLGHYLSDWLSANPAALRDMTGKKRVRYAIKRLLGNEEQRTLIRDIISALCESRPEPVCLVLPPNGELINWANGAANGAAPEELTDIDIDSTSVYLADYLRSFSGLNAAAILVELPQASCVNPGLLDLYSPIVNVARHYHWALGMAHSGDRVEDPDDQLQFTVSGKATTSTTGLLQSDAFWQGEAPAWEPPHFVYATVPTQLSPEQVLERLATLRNRE